MAFCVFKVEKLSIFGPGDPKELSTPPPKWKKNKCHVTLCFRGGKCWQSFQFFLAVMTPRPVAPHPAPNKKLSTFLEVPYSNHLGRLQ